MTNIKNDHFSGGSNINKGSRCGDDSTLDEILKELDTTGLNIWDKSLGSGDVFLKSVANVDLQTKNILNINNINVNTILVKSINGIDYTPGSNIDVDLITVNVTSTPIPRFWFNYALDSFQMNKSLTVPGSSLRIGNYTIHQDGVDGDGLTKTGSFHIQSNAGVSGNICLHVGVAPGVSGHGDGHRIWVDPSHNLKWQNHLGVSVDIMSETDPVFLSQKGANNGVATLDGGGKIPTSQLSSTLMDYKGSWNASTNIPVLVDGIGDSGDVYICSVAGTQNLGSGNITFAARDWVIYNGTIWEKSINSNAVVSVNGQTSIVSLDLDDINNGVTYGRATLTQITNWNIAYNWGGHAGLYDTTGTASGLISTHESTYNHIDYNSAYSHISSNGSSHSFINQSVTTSASPVFIAVGVGVVPAVPLHIKQTLNSLLRLERDGSADVQMNFLNTSGDTWTIGHDNSLDAFVIAASDDDFATNAHVKIDRTGGRFSLRSSQLVIDNSTFPWTTSKFNSQGVAWSVGQPARTPTLIFQAIAQDRPEISWYRGSRIYPEFSIRQHTTNDMGAEIYSGDGTSAPTMTMAFNLGNVGIRTTNPNYSLQVNEDSTTDNFIQITNSTSGSTSSDGLIIGLDAGGEGRIEMKVDKTLSIYGPNTNESVRVGRGSTNGQIMLGNIGGSEAIIAGDIYAGGYAGIQHTNSSASMIVQNGNGRTIISYNSSQYLDIQTDNLNSIVRLTGGGKVGIGTTSPIGELHIAPSWDEAEGIIFATNGTDDNTGGYLQFREREDNFYGAEFGYYGSGGSNRAYIGVRDNTTTLNEVISIIRSTGFVGINSTNPGLPLEVRLDNGQQALFFDSTAQVAGAGGGIAFGGKYTDAGAEAMAGKIGTQKTNSTSGHVGFDMVLKTQDSVGAITERMILTSDGLCGLHVPSANFPTKALDVWGDTRIRGDLTIDNQLTINNIESSGNIVAGGGSSNFRISAYINRTTGLVRSARFQTDGNHTDARGISIWAGEDTESGTNYWLEAYDGNGGTNTGGLRSVAGVFDVYNTSDERLKQNIINTKITGKDIISKLKVRDFEWKNKPGRKVTGFIAQEVMKIYPDAVGDPNPDNSMYSLSKTSLIPPIIKYIQELETRITELEK